MYHRNVIIQMQTVLFIFAFAHCEKLSRFNQPHCLVRCDKGPQRFQRPAYEATTTLTSAANSEQQTSSRLPTWTTLQTMASKLNPGAPEFVPSSYKSDVSNWGSMAEQDADVSEDHITPEELEELEATEQWVAMLVEQEELEEEHLVAVALRYAPEQKVNAIHKRFGIKPVHIRRQHKGIRAGSGRAW